MSSVAAAPAVPIARTAPAPRPMRLSGLEPLTIGEGSLFVNIGERTNVTGSRAFAKMILEGRFEDALAVARQQVENGAQIIDVNMDEAMLDSVAAMERFLKLVAGEPEIARVPIMIDSSKWAVIEAGLECIQGKGIVNSISLKEGEAEFRRQAALVRRYGAAAVVMAFDEQGQADTLQRKTEICARAYRILVDEVGFAPEDIVFDPNVFAIATGIEEHNHYAVDFIEATRWIKAHLSGAKVSGGISNVSFSFRGNDPVREAIHTVFLYHAIKAGLDMGIVNAGMIGVYDELDPVLRERVEDVVLDRRPDAAERLLEIAESAKGAARDESARLAWRQGSVDERLAHALVHGITEFVVRYRAQGRIVWLELGLQSAFDETLRRVNRGHGLKEYRDVAIAARRRGIPVCAHLILGLPGENESHYHATLDTVLDIGVDGLKLHPLHVVKHTMLANQWRRGEYQPMAREAYIRHACDLIERTPEHILFHRVTGTAAKDILLAPEWCSQKWNVLNGIERELARRGHRQGCFSTTMETILDAA